MVVVEWQPSERQCSTVATTFRRDTGSRSLLRQIKTANRKRR